jgi:RNA polymerase sigma factor (sigma-70 family)
VGSPGTGESALVKRAAAGDGAAFADVVAPLAGRLLCFIGWRGGQVLRADCDGEDVLQATLVKAWSLLPGLEYRGPEALYGWLVALAEGLILDRARYLQAKGRGDARHVESGGGVEPPAAVTSVASRAARRETRARLADALARLPEPQRAVVHQHLIEGRPLSAVADALGVTKNAVWERLQRALERLRDVLGDAP